MKIFAKNNTELENIFKRFHEQMENEKLESFKMPKIEYKQYEIEI